MCPLGRSPSSAETPGGNYGHTASSDVGSSLWKSVSKKEVGTGDHITAPTVRRRCELRSDGPTGLMEPQKMGQRLFLTQKAC